MITIKDREYHVIDAHVHVWNHFNGMRSGCTKLEPLGFGMVREGDSVYRFLPPEYQDHQVPVEILLANMEENGIEQAVILQNPCYGDQRDYVKGIMEAHPGKFAALGMIDPRNKDEVVKQMDIYARDYGFAGFKIEVPDVPFILDDPEYDFLWKKICDMGAVCALDLGWRKGPFDFNIDRFENVMRKFPSMRTVLCHLGISKLWDLSQEYPFPVLQRTLKLLDINKENLYFDISGLQDTEKHGDYPWPRTMTYLKAVKETHGTDRIMWGSDAPMILRYSTYQQTLTCYTRHCDYLTPEDYERILYTNARKVYFNK